MTRTKFILGIFILTTAIALLSGYFSLYYSFGILFFGLAEVVFVVCVSLSSPLLLRKHRFNYRAAAPYLMAWGIALIAIVAPHILQPDHFHGSFYKLLLTLLMIWLYIPFSENLNALGADFPRKFLVAMSLMAMIYSIIYIVAFPLGFYVHPTPHPTNFTFPGFRNIRHMGYMSAPLLALSIVLAVQVSQRGRAPLFWVFGLGLPVLTSLLLWSSSRSGVLSMVLGLCFVILLSNKFRTQILLVSVCVLPVGAALTYIYPDTGSIHLGFWNLFLTPTDISNVNELSAGRIQIWQMIIENIRNHPILGHGIGGVRYFARTLLGAPATQAHNGYLEYLHAGGVFAALCIFGSISFFYAKLLLRVPGSKDIILLAAFTGITVTLIYAFLDGVLYYSKPLMQTVILFAIANYQLRHSENIQLDSQTEH